MTKKISEWWTLTIEHDRNSWHRQTLTLPPKNMLVQSAWIGPPAPARKLALDGTPFWPHFAPLQEKNIRHGDPGHKIKVCWFQFWSCSIVKVCYCHDSVIFIRSSWFGHVSIPHLNLSPQYIKKYSTYSLHLCDFEVYIYRRLSFRWPL